jgi:hypothetical protein
MAVEFNIGEALSELGGLGGRIVKAANAALYQEANSIMNESKQIVPVDTGVLKASGRVEKPVDDGYTIGVTLGYGGAASAYAEIVHEDPTARHKPGKQYKYLEVPILNRLPQLKKNVTERIAKAAKK